MNWPSARWSRAAAPRTQREARAGERRAGLEIEPERRADRVMLLRREGEGGRRAAVVDERIVVLVRAVGHIGERAGWGSRRAAPASSSPSAFSSASSAGSRSLSAATSAISAAAVASSFCALAAPIAFDASLRRAWPACSSVISARRRSSSASRSAASGASPRRARRGVEGGGIVADQADVVHGAGYGGGRCAARATRGARRALRYALPSSIEEDRPCRFPTTPSCSSPTAARCCSCATKAMPIIPTCVVERMRRTGQSGDREQGTDAPGRSAFQCRQPGAAAMSETDFHQMAEDRFAADAADLLKERALAKDFESLIVDRAAAHAGRAAQTLSQGSQRAADRRDRQGSDRPPDRRDRSALIKADIARRSPAAARSGGTTRRLRLAKRLRATSAAAAAPNSRTIGGAGTGAGGPPLEPVLPPWLPPWPLTASRCWCSSHGCSSHS